MINFSGTGNTHSEWLCVTRKTCGESPALLLQFVKQITTDGSLYRGFQLFNSANKVHSIYCYVHHSEIDSQITHVTEIHCSYTLINAVKICTFVFLLLLYIVQCTKTVYIVYCCFYIVHILNVPERLRHDDGEKGLCV